MKKAGVAAAILIAAVAVVVLVSLGPIWLRLHRNQTVAESLAAALAARYPTCQIHGAASYERDVIYVQVRNLPDKQTQNEMRNWLAAEKERQQITVHGLLRFFDQKSLNEIEMEF